MLYRRSPSGFTLIELPIVGVRSALLIPRYWEVGRQARIPAAVMSGTTHSETRCAPST
ncbi:hypothetical protein [Reinekea blandensis]|uniref:Uncharacterized protein n=1 Tax=Reinekea blandensis MED297 TaxID=314283 RepID=A4BDB4_9GAMM|nr:hypothetical protein [Reinekea blandensis]EAR09858.1 hypothetical protein MED297_05899 [Reinekea sp. MED297] [Reinekea blandensis MED297]